MGGRESGQNDSRTSMWARGWASSVTPWGAGHEGRWASWHEAMSATKKILGLHNQRETGSKLRQCLPPAAKVGDADDRRTSEFLCGSKVSRSHPENTFPGLPSLSKTRLTTLGAHSSFPQSGGTRPSPGGLRSGSACRRRGSFLAPSTPRQKREFPYVVCPRVGGG